MLKNSALVIIILSILFSFSASAKTYYVDSVTGNDDNSGITIESAWKTIEKVNSLEFKPGDKILFKADSKYTGQLKPKGSGEKGNPIIIDMYGQGNKPLIEGQGNVSPVLLIHNVQYFEVNNLEITNTGTEPALWRQGVAVTITDFGIARGIRLNGLFIHDVNGSNDKSAGAGRGLGWHCSGNKVKSRFDGLIIENCRLLRCDRDGIMGGGQYINHDEDWYPSVNVIIRNNVLEDIGGDGIVPMATDGCLIEHNLINGCRTRCEDFACGIWPWSCDNTIVQFNEVCNVKGTKDGESFDSDYNCKNGIFQYNYSHDNDGGFMRICNGGDEPIRGNVNTIVRYNVSINDGDGIIDFWDRVDDVQFYNNLIYVGPGRDEIMFKTSGRPIGLGGKHWFFNNIFYVEGAARYVMTDAAENVFKNNVFYGNHINPPSGENNITVDPKLVGPLEYAMGFDSINGFKLSDDSPCIGNGIPVMVNGDRDFWGNKLDIAGKTDIGPFQTTYRKIYVEDYINKMQGGWLGQMAGVAWGMPIEFQYNGVMMPEDKMPVWNTEHINRGFHEDDLYVEVCWMKSMDKYGYDVSPRQVAIDFANTTFSLCHANNAGRSAIRKGIAPPDCSHPLYNKCADDIDYQIESDFTGLISPGMANKVIELGERFGRLVNYGDGLYAGQFVGGMYAAAFFENDIEKVIYAALECIPPQSQYYECIFDTMKWCKSSKNHKEIWEKVNEKYQNNPDYRKFSCNKWAWQNQNNQFNIDAKINGAYIVIGLMFGNGDIDKTITTSACCGQDSDCNPSNAAGVLGVIKGYAGLDDKFKAMNPDEKFIFSGYSFGELTELCTKFAKTAVLKEGGVIKKDESGKEYFLIPDKKPVPSEFVQSWEPGAVAGTKFTEEEFAKINKGIEFNIDEFAPGFYVTYCGNVIRATDKKVDTGLKKELNGKKNVLVTLPMDFNTGCIVKKTFVVPEGKTVLKLNVGREMDGYWQLLVQCNGTQIFSKTINEESAPDGSCDIEVDLSQYANREITLELVNQPACWRNSINFTAYWNKIEIVTE
ncbi:MAG TPA: ADP-ribosylglycohydrolase family protein [Sedimentisphaerales bacterium]|nr:ADP-ribosylglycohydrolase family protein [Sedimentisphaerales bacterium]